MPMNKRDQLTMAALKTWPGTPEELGDALSTALAMKPLPEPRGTPMYDAAEAQIDRILTARRRLQSFKEGVALLAYEEKAQRRQRG